MKPREFFRVTRFDKPKRSIDERGFISSSCSGSGCVVEGYANASKLARRWMKARGAPVTIEPVERPEGE
jgi:hypothetical protein